MNSPLVALIEGIVFEPTADLADRVAAIRTAGLLSSEAAAGLVIRACEDPSLPVELSCSAGRSGAKVFWRKGALRQLAMANFTLAAHVALLSELCILERGDPARMKYN
jgi:hypothetical protein